MALAEGHAKESSIDLDARTVADLATSGDADASSYLRTAQGRAFAVAYIESYAELVKSVESLYSQPAIATHDSFSVVSGGQLHAAPSIDAPALADLHVGMTLRRLGDTAGPWWKMSDSSGQQGWALSTLLKPADETAIR